MKKLFMIAVSAFCVISAIKAEGVMPVKNDLVMTNQHETLTKKEIKAQRQEKRQMEASEISDETRQQFYEDFGDLPIVKTERTPGFDEITFLENGKATVAYYDDNFSLVGTISAKAFEDLPNDAQDYISSHYADYTVGAVRYLDDNESNDNDMNLYTQSFEGRDSYFVQLAKDNQTIILRESVEGGVYSFS